MLRYAITDRARATLAESAQEEALLRQAEDLAESGVDFVQLREKDLQASALASLARKLLAVGDSPVPAALNQAELAAMSNLARTILNLHEVITRD